MNTVKAIMTWLRQKWWLVGLGLLLIAGGVWWWQGRQEAPEVTLVRPEYRDVIKTADFTGRVAAKERVGLRFALGGKLVYLGAKQGDSVVRGQTIASLDQRTVQKQLDKVLSQYETQRWTFEEKEADRPAIPTTQSQQRQAELDQFALDRSVMDVELQYLSINNYRISAPFDGLLVSAPVSVPGVNVAVTDTWELLNPDTLYFRVLVDEVDIDAVQVGQQATIVLDAYPDREYLGQVRAIDYQTLDTAQGSVFAVEVTFTQPVSIEETRVGMNGEARLLEAEKHQVLSVPIETLITREGQTYVEVMVDGQPQEREVTLGLENDDYAEITAGLAPDDQVILP